MSEYMENDDFRKIQADTDCVICFDINLSETLGHQR